MVSKVKKIDQDLLNFYPRIEHIACMVFSRRNGVCVDLGDLIQEGILFFYKVYDNFDPTKGAERSTYLSCRILGRMLDIMRGKVKELDGYDSFATENYRDSDPHEPDFFIKDLIKKEVSELEEYQRKIITGYYFRGLKSKEIAVELGKDEAFVCRRKKKAEENLRRRLKCLKIK